jgi:DNA-binding NtrC family response regulator
MAALLRYQWPGNVRELENAIERAVVLCRKPRVELEDLPEHVQLPAPLRMSAGGATQAVAVPNQNVAMTLATALEGPERQVILAALQRNHWNRQATASELDINRTTLYKKMRKYHLDSIENPGEAA